MATQSPPRDVLTHSAAVARALRVSHAEYEIAVELTAGAETYRGDTTIRFVDSAPAGDTGDGEGEPDRLFLDFRGQRIELLEVDGRQVEPDWSGYRLTLPAGPRGPKVVRVVYENAYDHAGDGFHRFLDPEDGEEYLYSNFEPYEAHRLFPSFDQPDIKGTFVLTVTAPAAWAVVGNMRELDAPVRAGQGRLTHRFERTPRISTYLVALVAGPYEEVRSEHRGLPLGIYCRRTLRRHLDPEEIVEVTAQGLDFYADMFDQPYPFAKYDQLFVPEFNAGAMENVGAVTIAETFVFRDPPTDSQRLTRAEVILHELAHMWFGDLVTMRWWNDLWLNESFATYVSFLAMVEATRFKDGWKSFNSSMKRWAYRQDQLVTTHPISGEVADTDATFLNFDGITYGKGASVLKQLGAAIGRDGFREGMRLYFRRHAWGNATLADFMRALEEGSGQPLGKWARLWLETPSLNTIAAHVDAEDGSVRRLLLRQTAPAEYPVLRPHTLRVALGHEADGSLRVRPLPARIEGREAEIAEAGGETAPQLVFPNHDDLAYAKVELDERSLHYVRTHLERVDDALLRQLLWMSLWEMVRDVRLRSTDFLATARAKLPLEEDLELVHGVLGRVDYVVTRFVPDSQRELEAHLTFEAAWRALGEARSRDLRIEWARGVIAAAEGPDVERLLGLLDGRIKVPHLEVDQDMRWGIAVKAVAWELEGGDARLASEAERDRSDRGQRALIRAEASRPTATAKAEAWERIHGEGYGSLKLTLAAMHGFLWPHQWSLLSDYVDRYFEELPRVFAERDQAFAREYAQLMFPWQRADPAVLGKALQVLQAHGAQLVQLDRLLREQVDELERTIAVRQFAEASGD